VITYRDIQQVPYVSDASRTINGIVQVSYNGNYTSLFTHLVVLEEQNGTTVALDGLETDLNLILQFPEHYILKPTIYKNGVLLQPSEWEYANTGIITFDESLEDANLIIRLK